MRFTWVSWKPPKLSPEAELQLAQAMNTVGKAPFIKRFWGLRPRELPPSEDSFFETHAAGLIYLALILVGFFFLDWNSPTPKKGSGGEVLMWLVAAGWLGAIVFYGSMVVAAGRYATWLASIERKYRIAPNQAPPLTKQTADNNAFYEVVAREIEQGQLDKVNWTRAVANSAGDDKLAKSLYVRYRAQALQEAHSQRARAEHEAQVLARERQKRQAMEAAARAQAEQNKKGCGIALLIVIGFVAFAAIIDGISNKSSQSPTTYQPPRPPQPPPTPSNAERRATLTQTFIALDTEYRALSARRATLDPNNTNQIAAFNRDAADYTRRMQEARAEKARLDQ